MAKAASIYYVSAFFDFFDPPPLVRIFVWKKIIL